jgi:transcriptional regulator with XRE-family HTH domain
MMGKTQADLRRQTDLSPTAIGAWKYGEKIPNPQSIWRIAEALTQMEGTPNDKARIESLYVSMMKLSGRTDHMLSVAEATQIPDALIHEPQFDALIAELQSFTGEGSLSIALRSCLQTLQNLISFQRTSCEEKK